jgi:uncharacterized protein (DUF488 family)
MSEKTVIFTIGHSNHELKDVLKLLLDNSINLLVDVRSSPYSKYVPHFNKDNFRSVLKLNRIDYAYLGNKIGGKPKNKKYYLDDKVNYDLYAQDPIYQGGINELIKLSKDRNLTIMCSEENPHKCHRHMLITPSLLKEGITVIHIRGDGKTEKIEKKEIKEIQTTLLLIQ